MSLTFLLILMKLKMPSEKIMTEGQVNVEHLRNYYMISEHYVFRTM